MRSQNPSEPPRGGGRQLGGATLVVVGLAALLLVVTAAGVLARTSSGGTTAKARPVWTWSPPMPHRRSYTASTEIGGKIYVAAGMVGNSGRPLDLFERFDPKSDRWSSLTPLPHEFSAAAGARLGQTFFVIGGNAPDDNALLGHAYAATPMLAGALRPSTRSTKSATVSSVVRGRNPISSIRRVTSG